MRIGKYRPPAPDRAPAEIPLAPAVAMQFREIFHDPDGQRSAASPKGRGAVEPGRHQ